MIQRSRIDHKLLSVTEVAGELGCGKQHVRDLIASGQLRATNIGVAGHRKQYRIRRSDLEDMIRSQGTA